MVFVAGQKVRASQLNVGLSTYSLYTGTTTAIPSSAWTAIPFATLATGTGAGLTVTGGNTMFQLAAGCWEVQFGAIVGWASGQTGCFCGLVNNASVPAGSGYAVSNTLSSSGMANQVALTVTALILSDGTYQVIPVIYSAGAATSVTNTNAMGPRLAFKQVPN